MIKKMSRRNRSLFTDILFIMPTFLIFTVIVYYPLLGSMWYSFTDWTFVGKDFNFVGISNYIEMFGNKLILAGIKNTLLFSAYTTFCGNMLALLLALVLDKDLKTRNYLRAVFYLPCLLCTIVVSAMFSDILQFNGLLNEFFRSAGLDFLVNDWFANEKTALPMLIGLNAWQFAGYGSVIYLAGLQTIPQEYYEAANIDGARGFKTFRHITFPLLMPSVTIMTFMSITGGLKYFEIPYVLTNGGPGMATETICTVIYRLAFNQRRFGLATALSVVFFIIIVAVSTIQVSYMRKREVHM